jgi:hypothetical protein
MECRKSILVVVGALAVAGGAHADMIPVSGQGTTCGLGIAICDRSKLPPVDGFGPSSCPAIADFDPLPVLPLAPEARGDAEQTGETQALLVLTDRQDGFTLCVYGLLGLGMCESAPWLKKLSLGVIPGWYHDGGPFQIGHSHAISPNYLAPSPPYCFVQRHCGDEAPMPQYRRETIVSLLRISQFTPTALASRGPPFCPL